MKDFIRWVLFFKGIWYDTGKELFIAEGKIMKAQKVLILFIIILGIAFVAFGTSGIFFLAYLAIGLILMLKTATSGQYPSRKIGLVGIYLAILVLQLMFCQIVIFDVTLHGPVFIFKKALGLLFMYVPFIVNTYANYRRSVFPSVEDIYTVSFYSLTYGRSRINDAKNGILKTKNSLSITNIAGWLEDLPRHSITNYINRNGLTDVYFNDCKDSLNDEHIYLIMSDTGSYASELLSVFTQKMYNHVSISFDYDLKTVVSYNGGEKLYPPGLNKEQITFFQKKEGASIIVYSLACSKEQKQLMIDRIQEINRVGSAYNMLGLVTRATFKPNTMFCSQFIYTLLKEANLHYFDSRAIDVRPTDFVEKDYYRNLEYCYKLKFN
jgi:hypothetical protein